MGMLLMPVFAVICSVIVLGGRADTQIFVFGTNFIPMLVGGLFSGLLIRAANKSGSKKYRIALSPSLIPAAFGILWYLMGLLNLGAGDSGREFFAGPFYLLGGAIVVSILAIIVYLLTPSSSASS